MLSLLTFVLSVSLPAHAQQRTDPPIWLERVAPYRVIANIYYVGTRDLSSFLITGSDGHILIDTGLEPNAEAILDNIRSLGFNPREVRVMLTTQAHYDHVAAHAAVQKATGARVLAAAGDAPVLTGGGKGDYLFGAAYNYPPVKVDAVVRDGDVVRVGTTALTAHLTPGHTKGATTWTTTVRDDKGTERRVVFLGSTSVNPGTILVNNPIYPTIAADYKHAFEVQKQLTCEVFLAAHASQFGGTAKAAAAAAGKGDTAFIDPEGCQAAIARSEKAFLAELTRQGK